MLTTEILRAEHRWIASILSCLETLLKGARDGGELDPEAAAEVVVLLEDFADGLHQRKEEEVVFPRLLERIGYGDEEQLGELLEDHVYERALMAGVRSTLSGALHGDPPRIPEFLDEADVCLSIHRRHMEEENSSLLPMIDEYLLPEDDERMLAEFRHLDAMGPDPAGVLENVRALCHRLGVPEP
jgi:hemerythrin-like domain-containing protein